VTSEGGTPSGPARGASALPTPDARGGDEAPRDVPVYDVAVVGAGPGGLSAALNLVRARRTTLLLDSNRPRNAATFHSHGFVTRDGVPPLELRRLGREEVEGYPGATFRKVMVRSVEPTGAGFAITAKAGLKMERFLTRTLVITSGVVETLPAMPGIRAFYGTSIHSCIECDAWEEQDKRIAVIGETDDMAERALLLSQWSDDVILFTNGVAQVSDTDAAELERRGIRIDHRLLADVEGDRDGLTGVRTADGDVVPRDAAFVRPRFAPALDWASGLGLATDAGGFIEVDAVGRTSVSWVYAAGDATVHGPRQLIVSAGEGAQVAAALNLDLVRGSVP